MGNDLVVMSTIILKIQKLTNLEIISVSPFAIYTFLIFMFPYYSLLLLYFFTKNITDLQEMQGEAGYVSL